eukprot:scaffold965_cov120-Isochrysis_galbana.AAC.10
MSSLLLQSPEYHTPTGRSRASTSVRVEGMANACAGASGAPPPAHRGVLCSTGRRIWRRTWDRPSDRRHGRERL